MSEWRQGDQIWQNFATLAKLYKSLANFLQFFLIWQNVKPTLANLVHHWAIFIVANGQILKNNLTVWSHYLSFTFQRRKLILCQLFSGPMESISIFLLDRSVIIIVIVLLLFFSYDPLIREWKINQFWNKSHSTLHSKTLLLWTKGKKKAFLCLRAQTIFQHPSCQDFFDKIPPEITQLYLFCFQLISEPDQCDQIKIAKCL